MFIKIVRFLAHHLPASLSYSLIELLASIPATPPLKDSDRRILSGAGKIRFGQQGEKTAWIWGSGPLVVFVHGWGGRGGQLASLADHVSRQGFRTAVFDVTAHGESKGLRVTFRDFITDVAEITDALGPVFSYVGHSAGGLGMMAARELKGIHADRYIWICAPRAPYVPVHDIRRILDPPEAVLQRFPAYYAGHFDRTWKELDTGSAFAPRDQEHLFLVYDENDDRVEHTDGERIRVFWPSAEVMKTRGLGHQKVLWDRQVLDAVAGFLCR